jgi:hypothetical protein
MICEIFIFVRSYRKEVWQKSEYEFLSTLKILIFVEIFFLLSKRRRKVSGTFFHCYCYSSIQTSRNKKLKVISKLLKFNRKYFLKYKMQDRLITYLSNVNLLYNVIKLYKGPQSFKSLEGGCHSLFN